MEEDKGKAESAGLGRRYRGSLPILLLLLISPGSFGEPIALSDQSLATVTAGTPGSSVKTVGPVSPKSLDETKIPGGEDRARFAQDPVAIIVVGEADAITNSLREVSLGGHSQASLRAANLINAAATDSASGLNILDHRTGISESGSDSRIGQLNLVSQIRTRNGRLDFFAGTDAGTERREQQDGVETHAKQMMLHQETRNMEHAVVETTSKIDAVVEGKKIFPNGVTVLNPTISVPDFQVALPTFGFDGVKKGILDEILRDKDGAKSSSVSGKTITFQGSGLTLGEITLRDDDIVIGPSTLTVPSFSLGSVTAGSVICRIFTCPSESFSIGAVTINDNELQLFDERIIEGANPIPGIVGYGGGFAFVGSGSIESQKGKATLQGSIDVDLGEFSAGTVVDFTIPWAQIRDSAGNALNDGLDVRKILSIAGKKLPEIKWDVDLELDLEFPGGFTGTFDGAVCFSSDDCGQLEISRLKFATMDKSSLEFATIDNGGKKIEKSMESIQRTSPAEARRAKAVVVVLSGSSAETASYSIVTVDDGAQSEMRALNAVNGARAIVGNGFNVIATESGMRRSSGQINQRLSQLNKIVQIGGL